MKGRLVLLVVLSLGYTVPSWGQFGGAFFGGTPEAKQVSGAINIVVRAHSPSSPRGDTSFTNGVIPEIVKLDDLVFQFQVGNLGARNLKGALLRTRKGDQHLTIPKTGVILGEIPVTEFAVEKDKKTEVVLGHQMIVTYVDQKDGYVKIIPIPIVSEILPFRRGLRQTDYGMVVFCLIEPGEDVISWERVRQHSGLKGFRPKELYRILYNGGTPVVGTVMRNLVLKAVEQIHNRPPVEEAPPPADQKAAAPGPEPTPLGDPTVEVHDEEGQYHLHVDWGKATAIRYRVSPPRTEASWRDLQGEPGDEDEITVQKFPGTAIEVEATVNGKRVELKRLNVPFAELTATGQKSGEDFAVQLTGTSAYDRLIYRLLDDRGAERFRREVKITGDEKLVTVAHRPGWTITLWFYKPGETDPAKKFYETMKKEEKS